MQYVGQTQIPLAPVEDIPKGKEPGLVEYFTEREGAIIFMPFVKIVSTVAVASFLLYIALKKGK